MNNKKKNNKKQTNKKLLSKTPGLMRGQNGKKNQPFGNKILYSENMDK